MLLPYNLKIDEMQLYYNYIYYHSQAYDCFFHYYKLLFGSLQYIYMGAKVYKIHTATMDHGKLGCVYAVTITAMSILLLREGNFQVLVILK